MLPLLALAACTSNDPASISSHRTGTASGDDGGSSVLADGGAPSTSDGSAPGTQDANAPPTSTDGGGTLPDGAPAPKGPLFAYASGYGPNILRYVVDESTGALTAKGSTAAFGPSPSFLAINAAATNLYAVDEEDTGRVGAYTIDAKTGALTFLSAVSSGGKGPAFVGMDRTSKYVFVANYTDGGIEVLPVQAGGALGAATDTRNAGQNAHMMVADPSNHFVFVPCLGSDYVAQYVFDASTGKLTPNPTAATVGTAAKAGPRHIAFHPNGKFAYLMNETASSITSMTLDATAGTLTPIETKTTLPSGFSGSNTGAEVWVHPSGKWVVGSNRGDDSLAVFSVDLATGKITLVGNPKSGGNVPRDFTFDATGALLFAANEGPTNDAAAGNVVPFRFDSTSGSVTAGTPMAVPAATFVGIVRLPAP